MVEPEVFNPKTRTRAGRWQTNQIDSSQEGGDALIKATGIVRRLDHLGRIVLPIELRRTLAIEHPDSLEIFTQGDQIVLRKYEPLCIFCGGGAGTAAFEGKKVCQSCRSRLSQVPAGL